MTRSQIQALCANPLDHILQPDRPELTERFKLNYKGYSDDNYYVYLLLDEDEVVRYVGKGCANRVRTSVNQRGLTGRIIAAGMSHEEALAMEARLITLIGPERLENRAVPQWRRGVREEHRFLVRPLMFYYDVMTADAELALREFNDTPEGAHIRPARIPRMAESIAEAMAPMMRSAAMLPCGWPGLADQLLRLARAVGPHLFPLLFRSPVIWIDLTTARSLIAAALVVERGQIPAADMPKEMAAAMLASVQPPEAIEWLLTEGVISWKAREARIADGLRKYRTERVAPAVMTAEMHALLERRRRLTNEVERIDRDLAAMHRWPEPPEEEADAPTPTTPSSPEAP